MAGGELDNLFAVAKRILKAFFPRTDDKELSGHGPDFLASITLFYQILRRAAPEAVEIWKGGKDSHGFVSILTFW